MMYNYINIQTVKMEPRTTYIYVLRLTTGKYYIGKTNDLLRRMGEHTGGEGSVWTSKYKPVFLEDVSKELTPLDEDTRTKEYMLKYGIDNVRGGSYANIELSKNQIQLLNIELKSANNQCFKCGKPGHLARYCPNKLPEAQVEVKSPKDQKDKTNNKDDKVKKKDDKMLGKNSKDKLKYKDKKDKTKNSKDAVIIIVDHKETNAIKDKPDNKGKKWTAEEDKLLLSLNKEGKLVPEISMSLKRTEGAVAARLTKLSNK